MLQGEAIGTESPSSSSGMISFELANGQPYGPHVPIAIDDDQYVEYSLDNMTEFPRNLEEEERVGQLTILLHAIHICSCIIDLLVYFPNSDGHGSHSRVFERHGYKAITGRINPLHKLQCCRI